MISPVTKKKITTTEESPTGWDENNPHWLPSPSPKGIDPNDLVRIDGVDYRIIDRIRAFPIRRCPLGRGELYLVHHEGTLRLYRRWEDMHGVTMSEYVGRVERC
jgi:hypothetical protein